MKLEVIEVERKGPIRCAADEPTDLVDERGVTVTREPHHLVLSLVDFKAEISRKGRVQHSEGMGKPKFT